jgi:hypothetical protein
MLQKIKIHEIEYYLLYNTIIHIKHFNNNGWYMKAIKKSLYSEY